MSARHGLSILAGMAILAACQPAAVPVPEPAAPAATVEPATVEPATVEPAPAPAPAALPLNVSINAVMVAGVDFAADGIWRPAASETRLTDKQWLLVEQDATNLVAAATLITTPGTGDNDSTWLANANWRSWSLEMQQLGIQAMEAAKEKDQVRLAAIGDRLVEVCQACHQAYKPGLPSMGITRFPTYPKRDGG